MPPLPFAAQTARLKFIGFHFARPWNCIMYASYQGAAPPATALATYAGAAATAWNANFAVLASTSTQLTEVQVTDIGSATGADGAANVTHFGTRAGTPFTAQVAMVSSWHINRRYRGGHPRNYWPFGVIEDVGGGQIWVTTFIQAASAAFTTFLATMNGTPMNAAASSLVSVSYHTAHALRPTPLVSPIQSVVVHPRVDTQRRRLGKEIQ